METFFYGMLAGWGLAIPVGPMAVLLITTTIARGWKFGAVAALGMISVDFVYALVSFALGTALIEFLGSWGQTLTLIGALILLYFGFRLLANSWRQVKSSTANPQVASLGATYRQFVAATFVNPATAFYFVAITAGLGELSDPNTAGFWAIAMAFSLGVLVASGLWQGGLVVLSASAKQVVTAKAQRWIGVTGGMLVIGLAVHFAIQGLR